MEAGVNRKKTKTAKNINYFNHLAHTIEKVMCNRGKRSDNCCRGNCMLTRTGLAEKAFWVSDVDGDGCDEILLL